MNQFSRTEMLLGKEALDTLAKSAVAVFGVGGVGAMAAETLARGGIGKILLCDDDVVCLTNINRQIIATHSTLGKHKADVMAERIKDINPAAQLEIHRRFYDKDTEIDLSAYNYIIDAVDTVTAKLLLIEATKKLQIPIISCMGTGNKLDPTRLEIADIYKTSVCPLAKVMRKELRVRGIDSLKVIYSQEQPIQPIEAPHNSCKFNCICPPESSRHCEKKRQNPGSVPFVPPAAGMIIAGEVIKDLVRK
ncbi:MAG: tRNA threonylcarbamoyladenosine dehydratase [Turicibacter sp.]|nr:tRNA threonylcarbamoyladenosine dehydratase [Turicibacter sp.]